jgi:hypothetical protein
MNTTRMPGFTAETSFYRSSVHYQVGALLIGLQQGGEVLVQPALRVSCGLKECCVEFLASAFCCHRSGDYCYAFDL